MSKKKNKQGFTLIELLVVIAIIGLLATLSVVALNNARERARDTRRISDVKQIQTALELYYNANQVQGYPAALADLSAYLNPVPTAPTPDDCTNNAYTYTRVSANSYCLRWCLGNDSGGLTAHDSIWATHSSIYAGTGDTCP